MWKSIFFFRNRTFPTFLPQSIAEVQICSCGATFQSCGLLKKMQLRICGYPIAGQHFYKLQIVKIVIADMRICCCGATFLEKVADFQILKCFFSSFVVAIVNIRNVRVSVPPSWAQ
jgi:hypothetical protein